MTAPAAPISTGTGTIRERQEMTVIGRVSFYGVALSAGIMCLGPTKAEADSVQKCVQDCEMVCAYFPHDKECHRQAEVCMGRCRGRVPSVSSATTPSSANTPFSPVTPFRPSTTKCLSVYHDGDAAYWLNHCPFPVSVRWDDTVKCPNWSCMEQVPANERSTAAISRFARWCECQGTLATCNIPATGC